MEELSQYVDATAAAAQLGRLDMVSLLLATIGLALALQFGARYVVLGRGEQKDCVEPKLQWCTVLFKDAANPRVNVVADRWQE